MSADFSLPCESGTLLFFEYCQNYGLTNTDKDSDLISAAKFMGRILSFAVVLPCFSLLGCLYSFIFSIVKVPMYFFSSRSVEIRNELITQCKYVAIDLLVANLGITHILQVIPFGMKLFGTSVFTSSFFMVLSGVYSCFSQNVVDLTQSIRKNVKENKQKLDLSLETEKNLMLEKA